MNRLALTFLLFLWPLFSCAQELSYYLPDSANYSKDIPTPASVIGHEVGEWHVTHDRLVYYMRTLAESSDRLSIETYGHTHEGRPLLLLKATAHENQERLEEVRKKHLSITDPSSGAKPEDVPAVFWMAYTVHGNEASGANASMLLAYHLAAAQNEEVKTLLRDNVVLIDPCLNPDGMQRFAGWVNSHKSIHTQVSDPQSKEFSEPYPKGRTNHYRFDLNRDWLPVQQPESKARLAVFHRWKPNILTDYHEMGTNSTYFFQPGVPERTNPLTPKKNQELTEKIAGFHAKALDKLGSFYYTKESFDDYYYGKGSTFPDINGCVGILFEQASSRGHAQDSDNGLLTFPFTIRNQITTSLSTLKAGLELRDELLEFQQSFYSNQAKNTQEGYVFSCPEDSARLFHFIEMLNTHEIEVYRTVRDIGEFKAGKSYVVPLNQRDSKLIEGIFGMQNTFNDSLFYDVSAWTMPLAFNLNYKKNAVTKGELGKAVEKAVMPEGRVIRYDEKEVYAYLFEWNGYYAPKAAYALMKKGLRLKVSGKAFTFENETSRKEFGTRKEFGRGTVMIPVQNQSLSTGEISTLVADIAKENALEIHGLSTGMNQNGIELGSPEFKNLKLPKILLADGKGINAYDAGEIWHVLDKQMHIPVSMASPQKIGTMDLSRYNVIIVPRGSLGTAGTELGAWVRKGGILIVQQSALRSVSSMGVGRFSISSSDTGKPDRRPYDMHGRDKGAHYIGGAVFETKLDLSHPLCFGFSNEKLPVFRNSTIFLEPSKSPYATPVLYTDSPLLSGYVSEENLEALRSSAGAVVLASGKGRVIGLADNPNFRAFWYGTSKLLMNAVFFGHTINSRASE